MIIPVRCMTCGKVLGNKWETFSARAREAREEAEKTEMEKVDLDIDKKNSMHFFETAKLGGVIEELGLKRYCCRRHMLSHVDLVDII